MDMDLWYLQASQFLTSVSLGRKGQPKGVRWSWVSIWRGDLGNGGSYLIRDTFGGNGLFQTTDTEMQPQTPEWPCCMWWHRDGKPKTSEDWQIHSILNKCWTPLEFSAAASFQPEMNLNIPNLRCWRRRTFLEKKCSVQEPAVIAKSGDLDTWKKKSKKTDWKAKNTAWNMESA